MRIILSPMADRKFFSEKPLRPINLRPPPSFFLGDRGVFRVELAMGTIDGRSRHSRVKSSNDHPCVMSSTRVQDGPKTGDGRSRILVVGVVHTVLLTRIYLTCVQDREYDN